MTTKPLDLKASAENIQFELWRIEDIEDDIKTTVLSEANARATALSELCAGHRAEISVLKVRHAAERQALQIEYTGRLDKELDRLNEKLKQAKVALKRLKKAHADEEYQMALAARRKATADAHRAASLGSHGKAPSPMDLYPPAVAPNLDSK